MATLCLFFTSSTTVEFLTGREEKKEVDFSSGGHASFLCPVCFMNQALSWTKFAPQAEQCIPHSILMHFDSTLNRRYAGVDRTDVLRGHNRKSVLFRRSKDFINLAYLDLKWSQLFTI